MSLLEAIKKVSSDESLLSNAGDFGYEVHRLPEHFKNNSEVGRDVWSVTHLPEGGDHESEIHRTYDHSSIIPAIKAHAAKHAPELLPKPKLVEGQVVDFAAFKKKKEAGEFEYPPHYTAHMNELEKSGAEVYNFGNYADDKSIGSKTSKGYLTTHTSAKGVFSHEWE